MVEMLNQGANYKEIAEMFGRTTKGVAERFRQMWMGAREKKEEIEIEGKTLVKMKTLDDYPARDLIKNLYDRGYRIENNKLYYIHKKEVNLADCCR